MSVDCLDAQQVSARLAEYAPAVIVDGGGEYLHKATQDFQASYREEFIRGFEDRQNFLRATNAALRYQIHALGKSEWLA